MAPFSTHGHSYESLQKDSRMSKYDDNGSIGSDTFREQRRRAYEECETDEQIFGQHNVNQIFDNRHHDIEDFDDLNSAGSSLGGYSDLGDNASAGGSVRTREELRLSLIARRRRLAQMENAMEGDASIDFSLRLNRRGNEDNRSLVSSLRDSIISFNDSLQGSLLSRKEKKKSKDKKAKDKKKKSKKKSSSKDKEREKRKEKDKKDKKKSSKHKVKEKEKPHKSKKSDRKHYDEEENRKAKKKKSKQYSSSESSSESESDGEEEYSKYSKYSKRPQQQSSDREKRRHGDGRGDKGRAKAMMAKGGKSVKNMISKQDDGAGVVQYACNEHTGMCAYHPDVQLRKKSRFGGWKDVLRQCPKCAAEQYGNGKAPPITSRRRSSALDKSSRSSSSRRQANGSMDHPSQGPPVTARRSKGSDRTSSTTRAGAPREGDRKRPPVRGMPRSTSMRVGSSQRQVSDNRARQQAKSDSSSSSSSSSSESSGAGRRQQQQQRSQGRRTGDPHGTSQPPVTRMSKRGESQRRGSSRQPSRESVGSRQQQQSRRREMSLEPPGADSDSIRKPERGPRLSSRHSQSQASRGYNNSAYPPQAEERRAGRERRKPQESPPRQRSVSSQRIAAVVDFDPPNPNATKSSQRRQSTDEDSHAIGSESDFALFQGGGGKAYNEEGMFAFFKDQQQTGGKSTNPSEMMNQSSIDVGREARLNSYSSNREKKSKPRSFHGVTEEAPSAHGRSLQKHDPQKPNLEGISAEALMNFVMSQSAHFDGVENADDLERALMEQVARLSIGSGEGDISEDGSKFSVLREVVKSYMNEEAKKTSANDSKRGNGMSSNNHFVEDNQMESGNSPKEEENSLYNLGDEGRRRDMIKDDDKDVALMRIASLQPDDPAFIRRTTGKWTFAKVKSVGSDSIVFIVNPNGSSKAYNVKYWVSHIRTLKSPKTNQGNNHRSNGHPDVSGRRGAYMKQTDQTRFSIKNLRVPSDDEDDS